MKTLIVYDSFFGNTEKVANRIYETLSPQQKTKLVHVSEAQTLNISSYELVIVGSPTRYYQPTPAIVSFVRGLKTIRIQVAFFDTRLDAEGHWLMGPMEKIFKFASDTMETLVRNTQAKQAISSLGVYVTGTEGPIARNAMKDVENWAKLLISAPTSTSKEPKKQEEAVEKSVPKKKADKKQKPASAKPAKQKAPKTKAASFDEPVYVVDLSTGNKIDLTVLTIEQLKQFAKDNFNKGYEDLDRDQLILLNSASAIDIKEQARQQGIKNYSKMRKSELIKLLTAKK
jgi:flavodoxin